MRHERLARALLAAGSLLLACVAVELGFRVVGWRRGIDHRLYLKELGNPDRLPRGLLRPDAMLGTVLAPNAQVLAVTSDFSVVYRTNSHGLRDREYSYQKRADTLRVLALGDSFTFGEGVSYGARFTDVAEAALEGVEIITAAAPGWGLESELVYLAREGVRYRPDWVVIFLNLLDTSRVLPDLIRDGRVELPTRAAAPAPASPPSAAGDTWFLRPDDPLFARRGFLARHSHALGYLGFRLTLARRHAALAQADERFWRPIREGAAAGMPAGDVATHRAALARIQLRTGAPRTILVVRKLAALAQAEGFRLMIVNIDPTVSLDYLATVDPGVVYHDLTPALRAEAARGRLTFTYDLHFNPRTHALIGRMLTDILRPLRAAQR